MRFAGFATNYYKKNIEEQFLGTHYNLESIFRAFKRKERKASLQGIQTKGKESLASIG